MREPYTQLYVHLVWATWDRMPLLTASLRRALYASLQTECFSMRAEAVRIGGTDDHVHTLIRLPATITIADLVKHLKGASSHLATHCMAGAEGFKWQGGYGALTVCKDDVPRIAAYIEKQEDHHRTGNLLADCEPQ